MEPKKRGRPPLSDIALTPAEKMARRREKHKKSGIPHASSIDFQIVNAFRTVSIADKIPADLLQEVEDQAVEKLTELGHDREKARVLVAARLR